jgi:DNA-binding MarR family transcriptional regulator
MTVSAQRIPLLLLRNGPPVRRVPLALARRFFQICTSASAAAVAEGDLTPLEFAVMAHLNRFDGERDLDQTALAARLGVDRNTTSLLVGNLESKGLLERKVGGGDRRLRLLRLTHAGESLFAQVNPKALEGQERMLRVLDSGERELLMDLLVRVIEANADLARPGAGRRKRGVKRKAA